MLAASAPTIESLHVKVTQQSVARTRMRVCGGAHGPATVSFVEAKVGADGTVLTSGVRVRHFRRSGRCDTHTFRWPFQVKFAGVGRYKITAAVIDSDNMKSASKSDATHEVTD